jgi:hypothetical protein
MNTIPIHGDTTCDECGQMGIRGTRYKCGHCINYNLCSACHEYNQHDTHHLFIELRHPFHNIPQQILLPAFGGSSPIQQFPSTPKSVFGGGVDGMVVEKTTQHDYRHFLNA